jgi:glucan biosynthesis protein C
MGPKGVTINRTPAVRRLVSVWKPERMVSTLSTSRVDRQPGLDRLRVGVMLAVLVLHAAIPYIAHPLPGLTWPIRHAAPSAILDVLSWLLVVLVMPLYFWLSGYTSAQSLQRLGSRAFLQSRWQRIGRPGLVIAAVVLPIELYLWMTGWVLDGLLPAIKLRSLKLGVYDTGLWGPSHLWYLRDLIFFCGLLVAWHTWVRPRTVRLWREDLKSSWSARWSASLSHLESRLARCRAGHLGSLALILPAMFLLALHPAILLGFEHTWCPEPMKLLFLGLFFAAGAAAQRHRRDQSAGPYSGSPLRALSLGSLLLLATAPLLVQYLAHPSARLVHPCLTAIPDPVQFTWPFRFALAGLLAGGVALVTFAMVEYSLADSRPVSAAIQDWSRASYWIFFVHHPLVAACHVALGRTSLGAMPQFLLTTLMTLGLCWGSYRIFVHRTRLGEFLDGRGVPRPVAPEMPVTMPKAA